MRPGSSGRLARRKVSLASATRARAGGRQWDLRIVVPGGAVDGGQLAVKSVADKNFEGLQWTVEGGADLGIPDVEAEGGSMIAIGGGEVC